MSIRSQQYTINSNLNNIMTIKALDFLGHKRNPGGLSIYRIKNPSPPIRILVTLLSLSEDSQHNFVC